MPITIIERPEITRTELGDLLIQGKTFSASIQTTVANGSTLSLTIVTPAAPIRVGFSDTSVDVQGNASLDFIEAPTVDTPGSAVTSFNVDRTSTTPASSTVRSDDAITGGTILFETIINAGDRNKATGGSAGDDKGWLLKVSTVYVIEVTNESGVSQVMEISYRYIEET